MGNERYKKIIELLELQEFISVIERDRKGNPIKVSGAFKESPNKTRLAENEQDFEEIYQRELKKDKISNIDDSIHSKVLIKNVNKLIKEHENNIEHKNYNNECLKIALKLIDYLNDKIDNYLINMQLKENHKEITSNENTQKKNAYPFYCQIGALFAQGFVVKKGFNYRYKKNNFEDVSKLSIYIKNDVLQTNKSVRQYINDTLTTNGIKNFYKSMTMMNNIYNYCIKNNINPTIEFKNKHNQLNNLH